MLSSRFSKIFLGRFPLGGLPDVVLVDLAMMFSDSLLVFIASPWSDMRIQGRPSMDVFSSSQVIEHHLMGPGWLEDGADKRC